MKKVTLILSFFVIVFGLSPDEPKYKIVKTGTETTDGYSDIAEKVNRNLIRK